MTELKLRLLKLAGGDLQRAKNMLEWIMEEGSEILADPGPENSIPHGFIQSSGLVARGNTVVSTFVNSSASPFGTISYD